MSTSLSNQPSLKVTVQAISPQAFQPYGWMLGKPMPEANGAVAFFSNAATDFWQEHVFDTGPGGETEILWVNYRDNTPILDKLEVHHLTEQAIVPLTGEIIHVVACSDDNGDPDPATIAAFRVPVGQGLCMHAGCWHATRVDAGEVRCLMLTRRSTTKDLISLLDNMAGGQESAYCAIPPHRLRIG
jgi:ureidoglycolate lyase